MSEHDPTQAVATASPPTATGPTRVFITYRHDASAGYVGRLYDSLCRRFGASNVFMDVSTIDPGRDFAEVIRDSIASSHVLLAVIGKTWMSGTDGQGERRLDDPADWVRLEIVTALEQGVSVIPVLLEGARMPTATELPAALGPLLSHQAVELTNGRWAYDAQKLIDAIEKLGARPAPEQEEQSLDRDFLYDAYVSYVEEEQDETWVWETLVPRLEREGLRVGVSGETQQPGVDRIVATEQGIVDAKRTIVVLSAAYLRDNIADFENVLAQTLSIEEGSYRVLPVLLPGGRQARLPMRLRMLSMLDLGHPRRSEQNLERLVATLKDPLPRRRPVSS